MTVDAHEARLTIPPPPQPRTDHPGNFIFLDPPYGVSSVKNYTGWDESDLTTFRDRVVDLKSRWIVTLDDSPNNTDIADPIRIRLWFIIWFLPRSSFPPSPRRSPLRSEP